MDFKTVLEKVKEGLEFYYNSCFEEKTKPCYQHFLKMDECKSMVDLLNNLDAQGFGEKDHENPYWWICIFIIDDWDPLNVRDDETKPEEK